MPFVRSLKELFRDGPEERSWREQRDWVREMSPPTKLDYIGCVVVAIALAPIYVVMTPLRWWQQRTKRSS